MCSQSVLHHPSFNTVFLLAADTWHGCSIKICQEASKSNLAVQYFPSFCVNLFFVLMMKP